MNKTIVALATPPLRSALAIVRLSGDDCFFVVSNFFSKSLISVEKNTIFHGYIKDENEIIDEVVLLAYKGPRSFTGEDSVEIMCHGSPLIYNKIISLAIKAGAQLAERGEYSFRAYLNGKMDLVQAEAINDMINAETEESKNVSLKAILGETSSLLVPVKKELCDLLAQIEASIDYSEYTDIEELDSEKIVDFCKVIIEKIDFLIKNGRKGKLVKDGLNIAIVGKPNVGKSSLLNTILNEEKAIVTDIKGTTRDIVEGSVNFKGVKFNFFDTAGIRKSDDKIETIGINKSINQIEKSDLILCLFDNPDMDDEDKEIISIIGNRPYLTVFNKSDIIDYSNKEGIFISAKNKKIDQLLESILNHFGLNDYDFKTPSLANERVIGLLEKSKKYLLNTISKANEGVTIDLLLEDIHLAYTSLLEITGEDCDFDIAKEIFSRFCLGK